MIVRLDEELWFPDPRVGEDDGLLAIGGDLSVDRLLLAYSHGIFPWYAFREKEPLWYCPMRRFVIFPNEVHVSHSMRTLMRKGLYETTVNQDFDQVIGHCSRLRIEERGAWLGPQMVKAYQTLHQQGFAASIEVWNREGKLAGGLYGVTLGRAFFGESMFSLEPNASKMALIFLARLLEANGGSLIDYQFETPHLRSMGGRFIGYDEYMERIRDRETERGE